MMNPRIKYSDPGGAVDSGSDDVGPVGSVWPGGTAFESTRNGIEVDPWFPALSQAFTVATWAPSVQCCVMLVDVPMGWNGPPSMLTSYRTMPDPLSDPVQERGASGAITSAAFPAWSAAEYSTRCVPLPATWKGDPYVHWAPPSMR